MSADFEERVKCRLLFLLLSLKTFGFNENTDYKGLYKELRLTDEIRVIYEVYSPGTAPREVPGEFITYPWGLLRQKSIY